MRYLTLIFLLPALLLGAYSPIASPSVISAGEDGSSQVSPSGLFQRFSLNSSVQETIDWYLSDGATPNRRVEWMMGAAGNVAGSALSEVGHVFRVPTTLPAAEATIVGYGPSGTTIGSTNAGWVIALSTAGALTLRNNTDASNRGTWEIAGWRALYSGQIVRIDWVSAADTATLPTVYVNGVAATGWTQTVANGTVPNWQAPALPATVRVCGFAWPNTEFRPGTPINRALTAAEIAQMVQTGALLPVDRPGGSMVPAYTSNFSSGVDGWVEDTGGQISIAGNIDGIAGADDTLRVSYVSGGGAVQIRLLTVQTGARRVRVDFDYYADPGAGLAYWGLGLGTTRADSLGTAIVEGAWSSASVEAFLPSNMRITTWTTISGGGFDFLVPGKFVYLKNIRITPLGALLQPELQPAGAHDVGPNSIFGTATAGITPLLHRTGGFTATRALDWAGTHEAKTAFTLPAGAVINSVTTRATAASTGSGLTVGSTTTANRFVTANTYTTARKVHALANRIPAGTSTNDLTVVLDPDTNNYTGTVFVTVGYEVTPGNP